MKKRSLLLLGLVVVAALAAAGYAAFTRVTTVAQVDQWVRLSFSGAPTPAPARRWLR